MKLRFPECFKYMRFILLVSIILFAGGCKNSLNPSPEITLVLDRDYYPVFHNIVNSAQKTVHCVMYIGRVNKGTLIEKIISDLKDAEAKGIEVKAVFEYSSYDSSLNAANEVFQDTLNLYGIKTQWDNPSITTHAKILIVDSTYILLGSTNWTASALQRNHEANILLNNMELGIELENYFGKIWEGQ